MINFFLRQALLILICFALFPSHVLIAKEKEKKLPNPSWVHPENRKNYPGYKIHNDKKKNGVDWQYATNRDMGNIRGGGTTEYNDYQPFYKPDISKKAK